MSTLVPPVCSQQSSGGGQVSLTRVLGQVSGKRSLEVRLYESGEPTTGSYYLFTSCPDFPVLSYLLSILVMI
jgi:hypothetical protein